MMRLAALLFLLLVLSIRGDAAISDSVCSIQCPPHGGSGTLVAINSKGHGLVISARHVFTEGNRNAITCEFPAAHVTLHATLLSADTQYDIAALDVANPPKVDMPTAIVPAR